MTDPTADAAKLLPLITAFANAVDRASFADGANASQERRNHLHAAKDTAMENLLDAVGRLATHPQPAPPAGEPDWDALARKYYTDSGDRMIEGLCCAHSLGLAARPKVEDAEVKKYAAALRDVSGKMECEAADLLERLAGELAEVTVDRDEWKQQHENLVGVRQTDIANLAAKIDGLKVELDRRKGDPRTRLHNLCEALQEDLDKSPYTREEWEQVDREIVEFQRKLREAEAKLAECEAELAKADAALAIIDDFVQPNIDWEEWISDAFEESQARHAARQQQKASAEPTEMEGG